MNRYLGQKQLHVFETEGRPYIHVQDRHVASFFESGKGGRDLSAVG